MSIELEDAPSITAGDRQNSLQSTSRAFGPSKAGSIKEQRVQGPLLGQSAIERHPGILGTNAV